jgi:hypothetical protein
LQKVLDVCETPIEMGIHGNRGVGNPNWIKGVSGNPKGGRPRAASLAHALRSAMSRDELARRIVSIARGEAQELPFVDKFEPGLPTHVFPDLDQQWRALAWFSDHAFGKAPDVLEVGGVNGEPLFDPRELTPEGRDALARVFAALPNRPGPEEAGGVGERSADPEGKLPEIH